MNHKPIYHWNAWNGKLTRYSVVKDTPKTLKLRRQIQLPCGTWKNQHGSNDEYRLHKSKLGSFSQLDGIWSDNPSTIRHWMREISRQKRLAFDNFIDTTFKSDTLLLNEGRRDRELHT